MEEKKHKFHLKDRSYLNDFKMDDSGRYAYKGQYFQWKGNRKNQLTFLWVLVLIQAACQIAAGCIPGVDMDGRIYILLPWVFALIGAILQVWAVFRITEAKEKIPEYIRKQTADKLPMRSMVTFILSIMSFTGEAYLLLSGIFSGEKAMGALYVGLEILSAVCALIVYRRPVELAAVPSAITEIMKEER